MTLEDSPHLILPLLPEMRSLQVFGQTVRYYDIGEGSPLLLIHGLGSDADVWAFCLEELARSHRVIAPDLLGFGRSDKPLMSYRITTFVEMLDRFLDALAIEKPALLGNSLGGWIAASFVIAFPERVHKLVLNDAVGILAGAVEPPIDFRPSSLQNSREVMEFMLYDKSLASDDLVELSYMQHLERNDGPTIVSLLETMHEERETLDNRLGSVCVPTLLLWGDSDQVSPISVAQNFKLLIKGARLEFIPKCGHIPALEKPQELVQRVLRFLAE
jgi:2-hydroxy-6-oxonona-2,4-dienedioate hydrolase